MPCLADLEVLRPRPGVAVVECKGEHDLTSRDEIGRLFSALVAGNKLVVVDVSEATFIDSSFIHNLLKANRLAVEQGARFRLAARNGADRSSRTRGERRPDAARERYDARGGTRADRR